MIEQDEVEHDLYGLGSKIEEELKCDKKKEGKEALKHLSGQGA